MKKEVKLLNIKVDAQSAMPVYEQVKHAIKLAILSGYLEEGGQLQPIREMAAMLSINPNTIIKVYNQLEVEGFVYPQQGAGYFVHLGQSNRLKEKRKLFDHITDAYIENAFSLGYSAKEVLDYLHERLFKSILKKGEGK